MSCFPSPCARRLRTLRRSAAVVSLLSLVSLSSLNAQPAAPSTTVEEEITVTATRGPRPVQDTPGAVSVISEEEIDRQLMTNVADLLRFEPGVYVDSDVTRLGLGGFNVRGIGGNRVLTRIDGIPAGERFEFGPLTVPQYALDLGALQSVEIVRSAGSALYGSDALGGVVTLLTKDPGDYLGVLGGRSYFEGRAGYAGRNEEWFENGAVALGGERWQGSLFVARSDGHELDNQGTRDTRDSSRTTPNPQDNSATNALGKLVFAPRSSASLELTTEVYRAEADTQVFSSQGITAAGPTVTNLIDFHADDEKRRDRLSLEQALVASTPLFDQLEWRLYGHTDESEQNTAEEIVTPALSPTSRTTRIARRGLLTFEQTGLGGETQLRKAFRGLGGENLITYGVSYTRDSFDQIRDRHDRDLITGAEDVYRGPLVFPTRYFPRSDVEEIGIFVQDELALANGRVTLVPGLRYDRSDLSADENDTVYLAGNPGIERPVDLSFSTVSPRLGVVVRWTDHVSAFGQYSRGFRSPAFSFVNNGFANPVSGYTTLPNPDLEPEISRNLEAGLRGSWRRGNVSLVVFRNRFDDFIETVALGFNPSTRLLEFQPRNVGRATISGVELGGEFRFDSSWTLRMSAAAIEGDNDTTEQPLNSIAPRSAVLGLRYLRPGGRWGGELATTFTAAKDAGDLDRTALRQFAAPSSQLVDLTWFFDPTENLSFTLGVFNLLDETAWSWPDVIGRTEGSPTLDRYTRPGRNVSASLRLRR